VARKWLFLSLKYYNKLMIINTKIAIIGGGPAGAMASLTSNFYGYDNILIDRESFPRDKICGDGLLLKNIYPTFDRININLKDIITEEGIENQTKLFINFDDKHICYNEDLACVKRIDLDNILLKITSKSTNILDKTVIKSIELEKDNYKITCIKNDSIHIVYSKYIIGADGYSSYIKRCFFKNLKFENRIASRYYFYSSKKIESSMFFDEEISPGYFWIFRLKDNVYNTGVYLAENNKKNIFELHSYFIKKHFNHSISKEDIATWTIPNNTDFSNLVNHKSILVGDAAGLCDKLFGHGIDSAILSSLVAIESIYDSEKNHNGYPLNEVYRYKLNQHLYTALDGSKNTYKMMEENPNLSYSLVKEFLK
jgi:flavin-dependent dehydrogenase